MFLLLRNTEWSGSSGRHDEIRLVRNRLPSRQRCVARHTLYGNGAVVTLSQSLLFQYGNGELGLWHSRVQWIGENTSGLAKRCTGVTCVRIEWIGREIDLAASR